MGYVSDAVYIQISRYKQDIPHHNTIEQQAWIDCVGSINTSNVENIESYVFHSTSLIENSYVENSNFYQVKENTYLKSCSVQITSQTFTSYQKHYESICWLYISFVYINL